MREVMIDTYLGQLIKSLDGVKDVIVLDELESLYAEEKYTKMVGHIARTIRFVGPHIRVAHVNSGGPKGAPAWLMSPAHVPAFGTSAFSEMEICLYMRKSFVKDVSFEVFVLSIVYQLSIVLLASIDNDLRKQKEAVILAIMVLGYRDLLIKGHENNGKFFSSHMPPGLKDRDMDKFFSALTGFDTSAHFLNSLTMEEVQFAKTRIEEQASV